MTKKTLKFDDVEYKKKGFHASKQPIALNLVNVNQVLISDKFEHSGGKNLSFMIEDDSVLIKYNEIWKKN